MQSGYSSTISIYTQAYREQLRTKIIIEIKCQLMRCHYLQLPLHCISKTFW